MTRPETRPALGVAALAALDRQLQMPQGETLPYLVRHDPSVREDADRRAGGSVVLRVRAEPDAIVAGEAIVHHGDRIERRPLVRIAPDPHEEVWEAVVPAAVPGIGYSFRLRTPTGQALLGRTGFQANMPAEARFRVPDRPAAGVPDWARGAVFYQVFPDRFARASRTRDATPGAADGGSGPGALEPWHEPPTGTGFKGGDLAGLGERLDALADLGVDALWLTPVFASPSNHRYDTVDFHRIDPRLGTEDDLRRLVDDAHERRIRVILDGVFNHVSVEHPFFRDVILRGPSSPYWRWFEVRRWPFEGHGDADYAGWWGHGHMPELDLGNPEVEAYVLEIGTRWIERCGIDGWRLDVAGEVPLSFWRRFRSEVRRVRPDAYLLAEVWGDPRPFVQGDTFDATMHYGFRRVVLEFLTGRLPAPVAATHLSRLYHRLPRDAAEAQYTLLGSHDVSRVLHDLGGEPELVALAVAIQFAYPGAPAVYYGDEVGLDGAGDPGCRAAYPWDAPPPHDLRPLLRRLTERRRASATLRHGALGCRADGPDRLEIIRHDAGEVVRLVVDRSARTAVWSQDRGEPPPTAPEAPMEEERSS